MLHLEVSIFGPLISFSIFSFHMIPVIYTVDVEPDVGDSRALFCSSLITSQLINEFLVQIYAAEPDAPEDLCVITTKDWSFYHDEAQLDTEEARKQGQVAVPRGGGPMTSPSRPPWTTKFTTSFMNQTQEDVTQILQNAEDMLSNMSKQYCVILDEQTLKDKTVLLVKTSRGPESNLPRDNSSPFVKYRSSFEEANGIMQAVCVGQGSLEELVWNEKSSDGRYLPDGVCFVVCTSGKGHTRNV
jgi:hypothetical protein